jgi:ArsR family transcriptional regulator
VKICIPVTRDEGLESPVSSHFGSAPVFVVCDTETGAVHPVGNRQVVHEHGACRPLDALAGESIDALIVGGIGQGALMKLRAAGIRVFRAAESTVRGSLDALGRGELAELGPEEACSHHGH